MTVSSLRRGQPAAIGLFIFLTLAGCSVAKLSYTYSDWLALRKMDAYLDLSPEQLASTSERLKRRLESHRREELPNYLDYLRRTRAMAADGLSATEADRIVAEGRSIVEVTVIRTVPVIAAQLSDLSPAQIQHLEARFEKVNRDFRRKYLPRSQRVRFNRRVHRATARIAHWTGLLSDDQRQLVAELRGDFPDTTEEWLQYNIGKQQRLLSLLRGGAGSEAISEYLISWWIALEGRSPSLEHKTERSLAALSRLIVGVDASLNSAQRRFLLWRLDNYIEQIEELIAEQ